MEKHSFDRGWRFHLGELPQWLWGEPDDSTWRLLDLPHDWSIELPRSPENPSGNSGGYFPMGSSWYRKWFTPPEAWRGKKVLIEFEGVYMNAEVWLNHEYLGRHPYGYTSFAYDLTPYLKPGEENLLAVKVDNGAQMNSRWYSGSGIYRHVWLWVSGPVHVDHWGVYVTTPEVSPEAATVRVETAVCNDSEEGHALTVRSRIVGPGGAVATLGEAPVTVAANGCSTCEQSLEVAGPSLWSPDTPHLYRLETELLDGDQVVDALTTPFGIRSIAFDAEHGFLLNGEPLALRGGCVHHDNGVMGSAAFDRSEERKVEVHKASGYNAIRCAHNPPSPAFLNACDCLGMMVIDEAFDCWRIGKNPYDYHVAFADWWQRDIASMVRRDRNHPCVIMWSIGNEVAERSGHSGGTQIARDLAGHVRSLDPTRPVTSAINGVHGRGEWCETDNVFAALDVGGYNYQERAYRSDHERCPDRVMYASESTAGQALEHWAAVQELPYVIGDFVWTSLDYLGESGIGRVRAAGEQAFLGEYPWHQANCGDLDLCGFKRPQSYYRDVLWQRGAPLYIAVHPPLAEGEEEDVTFWGWPDVRPSWSWPGMEGKTLKVDVYSACPQVELFLNGRPLGVKPAGLAERYIATFEVPYEPGTLRAVGRTGDGEDAAAELKTVGAPAAVRLTPDRATLKPGARDLSFVTVEVVDAEGQVDPNAGHAIYFTVQGEGSLAAVGSGDPVSTECYRGHKRRAFRGRSLAVVEAGNAAGELRLRAQADGLDAAEVVITVQ